MSVRELFRRKLENAEVIPDASVSSNLMGRLARREFLRFNPVRFNIFYLGGILVAGITASLILFSGSDKSNINTAISLPVEINKTLNNENLNVSSEPSANQKSVKTASNQSGTIVKEANTRPNVNLRKITAQNRTFADTTVIHTVMNNPDLGKELLSSAAADKNNLKGRSNPGELFIKSSVTEGCPPLRVQFNNKLSGYDSCSWTFGDGGFSNEKNPEWIFDVEGEYKVVLHVFGSEGFQATSSTIVTVYPKPMARFEIAPEKPALPDDEIRFYNYSTDAEYFRWDFGDGTSSELFEPQHTYTKFGKYNIKLLVSSEYGCSDSLTVINAFSGSEYFIDFPNAFIPNTQGPTGGYYSSKSDEASQVFHPVSSGISDYQLKIFSKLGMMIFESSDINIGWDGYFKGQLSDPGVYIWKVRGNFRNGEQFTRMGDVTLLRN